MPRRRSPYQAADFGTPELARHFTIVPKLSDPSTMTGKIMDGGEIDAMLLRDEITAAQHGTLTMFARRLQSFGYVGLRSPDYASPPTHLDPEMVSDKKSETIRGAVKLIQKMDDHMLIGPYKRKKLINLVLYDAKWPDVYCQTSDLHGCCIILDRILSRT